MTASNWLRFALFSHHQLLPFRFHWPLFPRHSPLTPHSLTIDQWPLSRAIPRCSILFPIESGLRGRELQASARLEPFFGRVSPVVAVLSNGRTGRRNRDSTSFSACQC